MVVSEAVPSVAEDVAAEPSDGQEDRVEPPVASELVEAAEQIPVESPAAAEPGVSEKKKATVVLGARRGAWYSEEELEQEGKAGLGARKRGSPARPGAPRAPGARDRKRSKPGRRDWLDYADADADEDEDY